MKQAGTATFSAQQIARRVTQLGREITRVSRGHRIDVVVTMDRAFLFAADLIRAIDAPVSVHFVREDIREMRNGKHDWREVYFGNRDAVNAAAGRAPLKGRDVLLVDAVLDSGVTQEFLLRRISESRPRSLRLVVLLDKTSRRRVAVEPDYFGFRTASNQVWTGYGLVSGDGTHANRKQLQAGKISRRSATRRTMHKGIGARKKK